MSNILQKVVRKVVAKIHPPLSLDPRETQQLLNTLNASFRSHLRKERDWQPSAARMHAAHVSSLLTSPLLSYPRESRDISHYGSMGKSYTKASSLEELQASLLLPPLVPFERQVALGIATLESAKECLMAAKVNNKNALLLMLKDGRSVPQAIVAWLWSSGLEESLEFVYDRYFIALLVPVLMAESANARVIKWTQLISKKLEDQGPLSPDASLQLLRAGQNLVSVASGTAFSLGRVENFLQFFSAMLQGRIHVSGQDPVWKLYAPAGDFLLGLLRQGKASGALDEATWDLLYNKLGSWASSHGYARAALLLHHPCQPDASRALKYIVENSASFGKLRADVQRSVVWLSLHSAELLMAQGHHDDAATVLQVIKSPFPKRFPEPLEQERSGSDASDSALESAVRYVVT